MVVVWVEKQLGINYVYCHYNITKAQQLGS